RSQEHGCRPGYAMVDRAREVDVRSPATRETGPRKVHVGVAGAARAVGLDSRLVVKFSEQIRRRRSLCDNRGAEKLFAIGKCWAVLAHRVIESGHPLVTECFLGARRVARALRSHKHSAMAVPRNDGITR